MPEITPKGEVPSDHTTPKAAKADKKVEPTVCNQCGTKNAPDAPACSKCGIQFNSRRREG